MFWFYITLALSYMRCLHSCYGKAMINKINNVISQSMIKGKNKACAFSCSEVCLGNIYLVHELKLITICTGHAGSLYSHCGKCSSTLVAQVVNKRGWGQWRRHGYSVGSVGTRGHVTSTQHWRISWTLEMYHMENLKYKASQTGRS